MVSHALGVFQRESIFSFALHMFLMLRHLQRYSKCKVRYCVPHVLKHNEDPRVVNFSMISSGNFTTCCSPLYKGDEGLFFPFY